jgi:hypothetical protein
MILYAIQEVQKYKICCTLDENKDIDIEGENSLATIHYVLIDGGIFYFKYQYRLHASISIADFTWLKNLQNSTKYTVA